MTVKDDVNDNGNDMKKIQSQQGVGRKESREIERKFRSQRPGQLEESLVGPGLIRDDNLTGVSDKHVNDLFGE